jgi:hypothetical protein
MKRILFYIFCALYLFLFFGSIYGLFVSELSVKLGTNPNFHYTLNGWTKNIACFSGLMLAGLIPAIPIVLAVYRALNSEQNN